MSTKVHEFGISVERLSGYEFRVSFDKPQYASLTLDEPAPLGDDSAPNAARVLAAAIGNCLSASLVFCLSRSKVELESLRTVAELGLSLQVGELGFHSMSRTGGIAARSFGTFWMNQRACSAAGRQK